MASYPRCPECGNYLNRYSVFFAEARRALNQEAVQDNKSKFANYNAEKMVFNPETTIKLGDLLDALGLVNICCRNHMFTCVDFKEGNKA